MKKISADFLKNVLFLVPGNVFWKDKKGRFLGCNNNVARIFHLQHPDDIVGKYNAELFDQELAKAADAIDQQVILSEKPYTIEEEGVDINGEHAVYYSTKVPLYDEKNRVIGIVGISIDITKQKQTENLLRESKEKAEIANIVKTEFLRNIEHDIRTPFTGIYSIAELLENKEQDPVKKEMLGMMLHCSKELLKYCNDILDFGRIAEGFSTILAKKFSLYPSHFKMRTWAH